MFEIDENEFALPVFKELGFTRRACPNCGSRFWSSNPKQETCGEVPCQAYSFLGNPPTKRSYDVREMRIQFLDYFAERAHTRIKPYPIVARWRDDVYLVGASIYDFQPYVTEGIVPPPANPLVISQPCIRFTDIDRVGPTAGRHYTFFEMGGHHAFNRNGQEVYWKDETIRFHHQLLSNVLGVPSEAITYKEHFWSGGGNAGPDLEGIVAGLEISTLVFMKYKTMGNELIPIPIRTVDTGYGIERWSWLSQGSPSGFHSVYGSLLKNTMTMANLAVDDTLATAVTHASGIFYADGKPWRPAAISWVAQQTALEASGLQETLSKLEEVYALIDHTKTLSFLLAEGVVPSNVGEGYLARLIIRRAMRLSRQLGISDRLAEIVEAQLKFWSGDFRTLRDMRTEVLEGLRIEVEKYKETISKGSDVVARIAKDLSNRGVRQIPLEQLVDLYDSQGLTPEIVREGAEKLGVEVEVPDNFLTLVAERQSKHATSQQAQMETGPDEKLATLPATRALYYDDQYQTKFKAKVLARTGERSVILDQTCFYPQGGGQPGDNGELSFQGGVVNVVDVKKVGEVVVHYLDEPLPGQVELVDGEIDWVRRQSLMRHHTSTHALIGAARRVLGEHVWQAGAQKDTDTSRLDITHYSEITDKEREKIERLVNQVILRNVPVQATWLAREKAEAKYGFRLYQGGAVPGARIRVVTIQGWDAEACGGTHCKRTGELGVFKIDKIGRLQDGVERIEFSAGESALRHISHNYDTLSKTSKILGTSVEQLPAVARSLVEERDEMAKELKKLREKTVESKVKLLTRRAKGIGPVSLVITKVPRRKGQDPVDLANRLKESNPRHVAVIFEVSDKVQMVVAAGDEAVRAGVNAAEVVSTVTKVIGGRGGGRPYFATGGGPGKDLVERAIAKAAEVVASQVGAQSPQAERVA